MTEMATTDCPTVAVEVLPTPIIGVEVVGLAQVGVTVLEPPVIAVTTSGPRGPTGPAGPMGPTGPGGGSVPPEVDAKGNVDYGVELPNKTTIKSMTAFGGVTQVTQEAGTAVGYNARVHGYQGTAVGNGAKVDIAGSEGTAIGSRARANGSWATAIGVATDATGDGSVAIGRDNAGYSANAAGINQFVLGTSRHSVEVPGTLTVRPPTVDLHPATKQYVDARTPKITVSTTAPSSPAIGDVWIDAT